MAAVHPSTSHTAFRIGALPVGRTSGEAFAAFLVALVAADFTGTAIADLTAEAICAPLADWRVATLSADLVTEPPTSSAAVDTDVFYPHRRVIRAWVGLCDGSAHTDEETIVRAVRDFAKEVERSHKQLGPLQAVPAAAEPLYRVFIFNATEAHMDLAAALGPWVRFVNHRVDAGAWHSTACADAAPAPRLPQRMPASAPATPSASTPGALSSGSGAPITPSSRHTRTGSDGGGGWGGGGGGGTGNGDLAPHLPALLHLRVLASDLFSAILAGLDAEAAAYGGPDTPPAGVPAGSGSSVGWVTASSVAASLTIGADASGAGVSAALSAGWLGPRAGGLEVGLLMGTGGLSGFSLSASSPKKRLAARLLKRRADVLLQMCAPEDALAAVTRALKSLRSSGDRLFAGLAEETRAAALLLRAALQAAAATAAASTGPSGSPSPALSTGSGWGARSNRAAALAAVGFGLDWMPGATTSSGLGPGAGGAAATSAAIAFRYDHEVASALREAVAHFDAAASSPELCAAAGSCYGDAVSHLPVAARLRFVRYMSCAPPPRTLTAIAAAVVGSAGAGAGGLLAGSEVGVRRLGSASPGLLSPRAAAAASCAAQVEAEEGLAPAWISRTRQRAAAELPCAGVAASIAAAASASAAAAAAAADASADAHGSFADSAGSKSEATSVAARGRSPSATAAAEGDALVVAAPTLLSVVPPGGEPPPPVPAVDASRYATDAAAEFAERRASRVVLARSCAARAAALAASPEGKSSAETGPGMLASLLPSALMGGSSGSSSGTPTPSGDAHADAAGHSASAGAGGSGGGGATSGAGAAGANGSAAGGAGTSEPAPGMEGVEMATPRGVFAELAAYLSTATAKCRDVRSPATQLRMLLGAAELFHALGLHRKAEAALARACRLLRTLQPLLASDPLRPKAAAAAAATSTAAGTVTTTPATAAAASEPWAGCAYVAMRGRAVPAADAGRAFVARTGSPIVPWPLAWYASADLSPWSSPFAFSPALAAALLTLGSAARERDTAALLCGDAGLLSPNAAIAAAVAAGAPGAPPGSAGAVTLSSFGSLDRAGPASVATGEYTSGGGGAGGGTTASSVASSAAGGGGGFGPGRRGTSGWSFGDSPAPGASSASSAAGALSALGGEPGGPRVLQSGAALLQWLPLVLADAWHSGELPLAVAVAAVCAAADPHASCTLVLPPATGALAGLHEALRNMPAASSVKAATAAAAGGAGGRAPPTVQPTARRAALSASDPAFTRLLNRRTLCSLGASSCVTGSAIPLIRCLVTRTSGSGGGCGVLPSHATPSDVVSWLHAIDGAVLESRAFRTHATMHLHGSGVHAPTSGTAGAAAATASSPGNSGWPQRTGLLRALLSDPCCCAPAPASNPLLSAVATAAGRAGGGGSADAEASAGIVTAASDFKGVGFGAAAAAHADGSSAAAAGAHAAVPGLAAAAAGVYTAREWQPAALLQQLSTFMLMSSQELAPIGSCGTSGSADSTAVAAASTCAAPVAAAEQPATAAAMPQLLASLPIVAAGAQPAASASASAFGRGAVLSTLPLPLLSVPSVSWHDSNGGVLHTLTLAPALPQAGGARSTASAASSSGGTAATAANAAVVGGSASSSSAASSALLFPEAPAHVRAASGSLSVGAGAGAGGPAEAGHANAAGLPDAGTHHTHAAPASSCVSLLASCALGVVERADGSSDAAAAAGDAQGHRRRHMIYDAAGQPVHTAGGSSGSSGGSGGGAGGAGGAQLDAAATSARARLLWPLPDTEASPARSRASSAASCGSVVTSPTFGALASPSMISFAGEDPAAPASAATVPSLALPTAAASTNSAEASSAAATGAVAKARARSKSGQALRRAVTRLMAFRPRYKPGLELHVTVSNRSRLAVEGTAVLVIECHDGIAAVDDSNAATAADQVASAHDDEPTSKSPSFVVKGDGSHGQPQPQPQPYAAASGSHIRLIATAPVAVHAPPHSTTLLLCRLDCEGASIRAGAALRLAAVLLQVGPVLSALPVVRGSWLGGAAPGTTTAAATNACGDSCSGAGGGWDVYLEPQPQDAWLAARTGRPGRPLAVAAAKPAAGAAGEAQAAPADASAAAASLPPLPPQPDWAQALHSMPAPPGAFGLALAAALAALTSGSCSCGSHSAAPGAASGVGEHDDQDRDKDRDKDRERDMLPATVYGSAWVASDLLSLAPSAVL